MDELSQMRAIVEFQSTPSVGRTTQASRSDCYHCAFQSTPSVGRTTACKVIVIKRIDISIHALRGEDDPIWCSAASSCSISIHALRGEDDGLADKNGTKIFEFQSTPSVGRTTLPLEYLVCQNSISIHALRGEDDQNQIGICL